MNRYYVFQKMLDFMASHGDVTDADMNYYRDTMQVIGDDGENEVTIQVTLKKKEVKEDA